MAQVNQNGEKGFLQKEIEELGDLEKKIVGHVVQRKTVSRNINAEFDANLTFGQKWADRVAGFGGSWTFIIIFMGILFVWIVANSILLSLKNNTFDPYPFILLNLVLSMLAAFQAPFILMSQNRAAAKDRLDASHDYEVNLKAEMEIISLHEKIDQLRTQQWSDLIEQQRKQIEMLTKLLNERGPSPVQ
jgi:uncharacterized membrane protein